MNLKGAKVLVTGGAGFIGSHLVEALVPLCDVVVLDNLSSGCRENLQPHLDAGRVPLVEGDVCDKAAVARAIRGCSVVFHCAVQCLRVSFEDPDLVHEVNATGTLNLCRAALQENVQRFVYVSSSEVYGTATAVPMQESHPLQPTTPYGASKLAGEMYALTFHRTYGLPALCVRPFNTYGPRSHFEGSYGEVIPKFVVRALNDMPPLIFGDGLQTRDFTYVTDTVEGLLLAAQSEALVGDVVNIACGQEASIRQIANSVLTLLGKPDLQPVHMAPRPADVRRHYASIRKAQEVLGYRPKIQLAEGLRKFIAWFSRAVDPEQAILREKERNWSESLIVRT